MFEVSTGPWWRSTLEEVALTLTELETRLRTILPEEYQDTYEDIKPVSMGSAGLRFGTDGQVAWDEMWATFCDLAMAGGPPHKGTLLEPGTAEEIAREPERYERVLHDICRGVRMVAELPVRASPVPGWVRVTCPYEAMAGWLLRAIVMENVSARVVDGIMLDLPAGPAYRIEKEIKNVVTVIAKTTHYWTGHMRAPQQQEIDRLLARLAIESPLVEPAREGSDWSGLAERVAERVERELGLRRSETHYGNWLGVECPSVPAAIWAMRAMVASNILSRREGTALFLPLNPVSDPHGQRVLANLGLVLDFARSRGVW